MSLSEAFAAVVRALRHHFKLSQDDLSAVDRSYLSRVERGKANVTMEIYTKIAAMLNVDPALLMLLTQTRQSGEPAEPAVRRLSSQLDALKNAGVIDLIASDPVHRTGRPIARSTQVALERAPLLKQAGMSHQEIAQELGVSKSAVQRYLAKSSK